MGRKKLEIGDIKDEKGHTYELQLVHEYHRGDIKVWVCIDEEMEYLFGGSNVMPESMKKDKVKKSSDDEKDHWN